MFTASLHPWFWSALIKLPLTGVVLAGVGFAAGNLLIRGEGASTRRDREGIGLRTRPWMYRKNKNSFQKERDSLCSTS